AHGAIPRAAGGRASYAGQDECPRGRREPTAPTVPSVYPPPPNDPGRGPPAAAPGLIPDIRTSCFGLVGRAPTPTPAARGRRTTAWRTAAAWAVRGPRRASAAGPAPGRPRPSCGPR